MEDITMSSSSLSSPNNEDSNNLSWQDACEVVQTLTRSIESINEEAHAERLRQVLAHLGELTTLPPNRWLQDPLLQQVADAGMAKALAIIYKHSTHIPVLRQAARLGRHLSRHSKNKETMAEESRLEDAVYALRTHYTTDTVLAQHLLVVLGNLAHSTTNKQRLRDAGAFQVVADVMGAYPRTRAIQHYGSTFIYNVATSATDTDADHYPAFKENGIVRALAHSIHTFPDDQESMPWALHALRMLATTEQLRDECIKAGAIEACVAHLAHADNDSPPSELKHAAETLHVLIASPRNPDGLEALRKIDNVAHVLNTCMHHHAHMRGRLSAVFAYLVEEMPIDSFSKSVLEECPSPVPLLKYLNKAKDDEVLMTWGCKQLYRMGYHGEHRQLMAKNSCYELIIELLQLYSHNEELVEAATGVLWLLCFREEMKEKIKSNGEGLKEFLHSAQQSFHRNGHIQERVNAVLSMCQLR